MEGYKNNQIRQKKHLHTFVKKNIMNKLGSKRVIKTYT